MFNIFLVLFVFAELSFYLLIAQTGIVEVFHSDIFAIAYLPIGGAMATYLNAYIKVKEHYKVISLLLLQIIMTFLYPFYTPFTLFFLGIAVGGISPLIIQTLKKATLLELGFSLGGAYALGTLLFSSNPMNREILGVILSSIALFGYLFTQYQKSADLSFQKEFFSYPLVLMFIWVFLDASLFETLSRDTLMSIWRGGYTTAIILFHLLGLVVAITLRLEYYLKSMLITLLFLLSYLFYFIDEPLLLSFVYPFVISYYNVVILQSLIKVKSLKTIGLFMVFIGWIASGGGLMVATQNLIEYIPILIPMMLLHDSVKQLNFKKGVISWLKG